MQLDLSLLPFNIEQQDRKFLKKYLTNLPTSPNNSEQYHVLRLVKKNYQSPEIRRRKLLFIKIGFNEKVRNLRKNPLKNEKFIQYCEGVSSSDDLVCY